MSGSHVNRQNSCSLIRFQNSPVTVIPTRLQLGKNYIGFFRISAVQITEALVTLAQSCSCNRAIPRLFPEDAKCRNIYIYMYTLLHSKRDSTINNNIIRFVDSLLGYWWYPLRHPRHFFTKDLTQRMQLAKLRLYWTGCMPPGMSLFAHNFISIIFQQP